jgi:VanZ family protein
MALIFSASTGAMSSGNTSRILGPIVRWIFPEIGEETLWMIIVVIRKAAHMVEYAILSGLLWWAFRRPVRGDTRPWQWRPAAAAFGVAAVYAMTDEFHQGYVPSREASLRDVGFDVAGAWLGLVLIWVWGRGRKRW